MQRSFDRDLGEGKLTMVKKKHSKQQRLEAIAGYLFILPWIVGFGVFFAGPTIASFFYSFTKYNLMRPPEFIGLANYQKIFFGDPRFWISLRVTGLFLLGHISLVLICGFLLALLLNQPTKGVGLARTIYYLPSVLPSVAIFMIWLWVLSKQFGLLNYFLHRLGLPPQGWLLDPKWVVPSIILMSLWALGAVMIIFLAGLQSLSTTLYEAAELDGAHRLQKFRYITLPMMTPIIFFNLIMQIIASFQVFGPAFVMTQGGPADASLFYVYYLYLQGFVFFKMGRAAAMAWLLFVFIMIATLIVLKSQTKWVYYEAEVKGR